MGRTIERKDKFNFLTWTSRKNLPKLGVCFKWNAKEGLKIWHLGIFTHIGMVGWVRKNIDLKYSGSRSIVAKITDVPNLRMRKTIMLAADCFVCSPHKQLHMTQIRLWLPGIWSTIFWVFTTFRVSTVGDSMHFYKVQQGWIVGSHHLNNTQCQWRSGVVNLWNLETWVQCWRWE